MSDEPLALKAPAARAFEVEAMRFEIRYTLFEDKPLCHKTTAWLRRLQTALVDEHCSTESYREIEKAGFEVIPAEEAEELRRREATGRLSSGTKELTGA